eukprot:gene5877-21816_t
MNNEKTGYCNKGYLYYSPGCSGGRWTIDVGKSPDDSGDSGCGNVAVSPVTTSATPRAGGWTVFCDGGNTTMTISGYNMATSDPPPACPTPAPFYSSVTFGDWVSMTQNGCGGQDYRALLVSSLACSAPSGCACAMDSAITLYDYNGQDVQLRDQAACTTTPKPCPSNVAYTYTWGDCVVVIAGLVALYMRASSKEGQQGQQGQQQQQQPSVSEFGSTYEVGNFNGKGRAGPTANRVTTPTFEVPGAAVAAAAQSAPPATGAGGTTNYATYAPQPSEARGGGAGAEGASSGSSNVVYATYAGDSDGAGTAGAGAGSAPLKASSAHSYSTYAPPPGSPSSTRTRTSTSNNRDRSGTNRGNRGNNESAYNVLAPRTNEDSQTYSVAVHNTSRPKAASASASAAPSSTTYDRLGQNQKGVSSSGRSGGGGSSSTSTSNGNGNNYDALGTHPSRSNAATTGKGAARGPSATTSWDGYEMQNTGYSSVSPGQAAGRDATAPRLRS